MEAEPGTPSISRPLPRLPCVLGPQSAYLHPGSPSRTSANRRFPQDRQEGGGAGIRHGERWNLSSSTRARRARQGRWFLELSSIAERNCSKNLSWRSPPARSGSVRVSRPGSRPRQPASRPTRPRRAPSHLVAGPPPPSPPVTGGEFRGGRSSRSMRSWSPPIPGGCYRGAPEP